VYNLTVVDIYVNTREMLNYVADAVERAQQ
jgi:hypothetical protein